MTRNMHIEFTVTPTPGPGWGTNRRVDISIPVRKFRNMSQVYALWKSKTGNTAKLITKGNVKEVG